MSTKTIIEKETRNIRVCDLCGHEQTYATYCGSGIQNCARCEKDVCKGCRIELVITPSFGDYPDDALLLCKSCASSHEKMAIEYICERNAIEERHNAELKKFDDEFRKRLVIVLEDSRA